MLGDRGYLAIVPGTDYAACTIWRNGSPHYTQIQHVGDDPLYEFLPEKGPEAADNTAINAVHRKAYRQVIALSRSYGEHIYGPQLKADHAKRRKQLRKAMLGNPDWQSVSTHDGQAGVVRLSGSKRIVIQCH